MQDRIIRLYEEKAAAWDADRGRNLIEQPWLDRFAALIPDGGAILDIGCGMGEPIADYLIARGHAVTGLDSSSSLIGMARARFPDQEWLVADMREMALDRRFDGLIAWHSLFHLRPADQRPMFARFAAHAKPGAALLFTSGTEHGDTIGEWQGEPLYHGSLALEEYEALLQANGFAVVERRLDDPECGGANVWLACKA